MVSNIDLIQFYRCKSLNELLIRATGVLQTIGFDCVSLKWTPAPTAKAVERANHQFIWDNFEAHLGAASTQYREAFSEIMTDSLTRLKKNTMRCQLWKTQQIDVFRLAADAPEAFGLTQGQFNLPRAFAQRTWTEFIAGPLCKERDRTLLILAKTQAMVSDETCSAAGQTLSAFISAYRGLYSRYGDFALKAHVNDSTTRLSNREIECLQWLALGKTLHEAATILNISERTLRFHIMKARDRLGVATTMQAVVAAALMYGFDPRDSRRSMYTAIRRPETQTRQEL